MQCTLFGAHKTPTNYQIIERDEPLAFQVNAVQVYRIRFEHGSSRVKIKKTVFKFLSKYMRTHFTKTELLIKASANILKITGRGHTR